MASDLMTWALPQLARLLPLDQDSLKQIITYTDTLPKDAAAGHLKDFLGDSPQALEFISSFNNRRPPPPSAQTSSSQNASPSRTAQSEVPRATPRTGKKKANIHNLPARQIQDRGSVSGGAYIKRDESDYMNGASRAKKGKDGPLANTLALTSTPEAVQQPAPTNRAQSSRPPPSASGPLISDSLSPKPSRTSSPAPGPTKTKVNISGGMAMHGASTALSDLDSAIRSLEIQTNPSLSTASQTPADLAKRRCNCMATRHPLLTIAPNCLNCGKIVCVKEGLGPCTFCSSPLLSGSEIGAMVRVLKDERGKERQKAGNAAHKRADVSVGKARAFSGREFLATPGLSASNAGSPFSSGNVSEVDDSSDGGGGAGRELGTRGKIARGKQGFDAATEHRDRLLDFQAQNAKRTTVHDEAADFDVPASGTNMWASPQERALQLKRQQKVLREQEWNARPEYERRKMVASIDVVGGKVVRRMVEAERPDHGDDHDDDVEMDADVEGHDTTTGQHGGGGGGAGGKTGAFSKNPLMGALIRPVAKQEKGKEGEQIQPDGDGSAKTTRNTTWRRVQDDNDDNEHWILDGGTYGGHIDGRVLGQEERAVGS